MLGKFSSFFLAEKFFFVRVFFWFWPLFSDSLAFSPSIAPLFRPKRPPGARFGAKAKFHRFFSFLVFLLDFLDRLRIYYIFQDLSEFSVKFLGAQGFLFILPWLLFYII